MVQTSCFPPKRVHKKTHSVLFSLTILTTILFFAACSAPDESAVEEAIPIASTSTTGTTDDEGTDDNSTSGGSSSSLASSVTDELSSSLKGQLLVFTQRTAGHTSNYRSSSNKNLNYSLLTQDQIDQIIAAATEAIDEAGLEESEDLIAIMPKIIEGTQAKLTTVGLVDSTDAIKVINVIVDSLAAPLMEGTITFQALPRRKGRLQQRLSSRKSRQHLSPTWTRQV